MNCYNWTELTFGKHQGKILPEVLLNDPYWVFTTIDSEAFLPHNPELYEQADVLFCWSRCIRLPKGKLIEILYPTGCMLPEDGCNYYSGLTESIDVVFDMWEFYKNAENESDFKTLMFSFKKCFWGDGNIRLSREQCENFFNNRENFNYDKLTNHN